MVSSWSIWRDSTSSGASSVRGRVQRLRNRWRSAVSSTSDMRAQIGESVSLRASIGTLVVLGLRDIRMAASPTTAYLMVGGQCSSDCAYCGPVSYTHLRAHETRHDIVC